MRIDRRDLKWRARDAMRAARPNALLMTFVYLLLTAGLSGVVSWFAADPLSNVLHLYTQGLTLDRALPLALMAVGRMGIFWNILMAVCGVVIDFGYKIWCLNTARGQRGELSDLFGGFSMVGRILWLRVLILVYGFLWYIAIFMPATYIGMFFMLIPPVGPWISGAVLVIAVVVWLSRVARYAMAVYCLSDEPEMGAPWALRRSVHMMQGRVKDYMLLMLSFLGWVLAMVLIVSVVGWILTGITIVLYEVVGPQVGQLAWISPLLSVLILLPGWIFALWLNPYMTITECNFYEQIKGGAESASI